MRISDQAPFIGDLGSDFRRDALNQGNDTTMAVGEEGGGATTLAVGEEGGGEMTTLAVGEEGGGEVTSLALGEEGCGGTSGGEDSGAPGLGGGPTQLEHFLELFIRDFGR